MVNDIYILGVSIIIIIIIIVLLFPLVSQTVCVKQNQKASFCNLTSRTGTFFKGSLSFPNLYSPVMWAFLLSLQLNVIESLH